MLHIEHQNCFHGNQKVLYLPIPQRKYSIYIPKTLVSKMECFLEDRKYPKAFSGLFLTTVVSHSDARW